MKPTFTVYNAVTHGTPYQNEALRMMGSLARFGIPYLCDTYDPSSSWVANCAAKAKLIRRARDLIRGPMVWLDADAEVVRYPVLFDELDGDEYDIGIHLRGKEGCISCTVWFPDTDRAFDLIDRWVEACTARPDIWDQKHLNPLRDEFRFADLGREYAALHRLDPWDASTVIKQHQASRRFKKGMTK